MRLDDPAAPKTDNRKFINERSVNNTKKQHSSSMTNNVMGNAFATAFKKNK